MDLPEGAIDIKDNALESPSLGGAGDCWVAAASQRREPPGPCVGGG